MALYLSPNGRIAQSTYWQGVIVLLVLSVLISALSAYASPFVGFLSLLLIWPWIAVHVKRFHDAGKTGWLTVAMVVLAIIVSFVAGLILPPLFGVDMAGLQAEMQRDMEDMAASNDPAAMMAATMEHSRRIAQASLIPNILASVLSVGVVGIVMGLFKSDPNENQYGPPTA
ncbi:DUF805 domain-containing protein [Hyphomonas pacifica]|uniref:Uncharacterized protein n=1 Tax=Hyphomonas pacifica TaxID=1280941 RepID=A0A062U1F5_9PROT|nr:DUF805 domain-containing protein [Hyphomonas pacifica]KCZ52107.1 hypothetical protein HY2_09700 [Hyphomonas pacifica]RAN32289.1 hypothetical protein HY3_02895 [Hyphomonas pacifica]RAN33823.1 hypothetical protein HY11_03775 [Hyphomonas pacifica]